MPAGGFPLSRSARACRGMSAYFRALPCETIVPEDGICPSTKTRRERETPVTELKGQKKIKKHQRVLPALSEAFVRRLGSCDKAGDGVRVLS